jgi:cytoskeletal protein CcmA (bactofilin family)
MDGREVPPLVVTSDHALVGTHAGSVQVEAGHFELSGTLNGSLTVQSGAGATISGTQNGSIYVAPGVTVKVTGTASGSLHVDRGACVVIEPGGTQAGTLHNQGRVVLRGIRGGAVSGQGELAIEGAGRVKQPVTRDGIEYYEWP